jgi:uncharacterized membrane protein
LFGRRAQTVNAGNTVHRETSRRDAARGVAALASRSRAERLGDAITRLLGSTIFLIIHFVWFGLWVLAGLDLVSGLPAFDPFPLAFLTLVVSLEASKRLRPS